jgi:hypothetical protein
VERCGQRVLGIDDPAADLAGHGVSPDRIDVGHRHPATRLGQPPGEVGTDVPGSLHDNVGAGKVGTDGREGGADAGEHPEGGPGRWVLVIAGHLMGDDADLGQVLH